MLGERNFLSVVSSGHPSGKYSRWFFTAGYCFLPDPGKQSGRFHRDIVDSHKMSADVLSEFWPLIPKVYFFSL